MAIKKAQSSIETGLILAAAVVIGTGLILVYNNKTSNLSQISKITPRNSSTASSSSTSSKGSANILSVNNGNDSGSFWTNILAAMTGNNSTTSNKQTEATGSTSPNLTTTTTTTDNDNNSININNVSTPNVSSDTETAGKTASTAGAETAGNLATNTETGGTIANNTETGGTVANNTDTDNPTKIIAGAKVPSGGGVVINRPILIETSLLSDASSQDLNSSLSQVGAATRADAGESPEMLLSYLGETSVNTVVTRLSKITASDIENAANYTSNGVQYYSGSIMQFANAIITEYYLTYKVSELDTTTISGDTVTKLTMIAKFVAEYAEYPSTDTFSLNARRFLEVYRNIYTAAGS